MEYLKTDKLNLDVFLRAKDVLDKENFPYREIDWNVYFKENGINYKYSFYTNKIEALI